MAALQSLCVLLGWMAESLHSLRLHALGWAAFVAAWFPIFLSLLADTKVEPRIATLAVALFVLFCSFGAVQMAHFHGLFGDAYIHVEYAYTLLSLVAKGLMPLVLLTATSL